MTKSAGERDFSAQEVMHHLSLSPEGCRKVYIKNKDVETEPSKLDHHVRRSIF